MREVIIRLNADHIKVKGAEYVRDYQHGKWIVHKERTEVNDGFVDFFPTEYECSNCGLKQSMYFINSKPSNFCPNCGADMRKGADDEVR